MGIKHVPEYDETDDVIDPSFFEKNAAEFAGVINGQMDRDNFPAATLAVGEIDRTTDQVFTALHHTGLTSDTDFPCDTNNTGFQGGAAAAGADGIAYESWTALQDAHYDFHFSVAWVWAAGVGYSASSNRASLALPDERDDVRDQMDTILFQGSIDGNVLFTLGPFDDGALRSGAAGVGAIQLPAGFHEARVEAIVVRRSPQSGITYGRCTNAPTITSRCGCIVEQSR